MSAHTSQKKIIHREFEIRKINPLSDAVFAIAVTSFSCIKKYSNVAKGSSNVFNWFIKIIFWVVVIHYSVHGKHKMNR